MASKYRAMTKLPRDKKPSPPKSLENPAELDFYRKLLNGKLSGIERWVLAGERAKQEANQRLASPQRGSA